MKHKMNRNNLLTKDDIWNAVIKVICTTDFPKENKLVHEAYIVFQYHSELESGGHESLFNWMADYINEAGIANFLTELKDILEKIGAHEYAAIEKRYLEKIWGLFKALENDETKEEELYQVIEAADNEYYQLDGKLAELLEAYFVSIYTDLIEVTNN
ncbi:DMP19 family protein [Neobacillus kokaensis]|uniref:DNA mimic protein DMP19 C-terminal domain-containing protein n=1 Tax=Neobacillus kokaensis TaxID=2759023 RepID=A0ABQ3N759_9BACI|nr:hypothetical protein [Neobacillus kokaensis]GHH99823.1 hypothetical protein AM1BK_33660 [Neobacillus kokaensis]